MCIQQTKRFQFLLRARRIAAPVPTPQKFYCEMSGQEYCGACAISTCPANIAADKHPSGCLYMFYEQRKKEFDKYDIMYAFGIKERAYKNLYDAGHAATTDIVTLYKIISLLRARNANAQCQRCGIFLDGDQTVCQNHTACSSRRHLIQNVLMQSNLKYPEFKASTRDVYLLLRYRNDVDLYLHEQQNANLSNLCHLFGLNPKTYNTLISISVYNRD